MKKFELFIPLITHIYTPHRDSESWDREKNTWDTEIKREREYKSVWWSSKWSTTKKNIKMVNNRRRKKTASDWMQVNKVNAWYITYCGMLCYVSYAVRGIFLLNTGKPSGKIRRNAVWHGRSTDTFLGFFSAFFFFFFACEFLIKYKYHKMETTIGKKMIIIIRKKYP